MGCYLFYHEGPHSDDKLSEEQMVSCLVLEGPQLKNLKDSLNKLLQTYILSPSTSTRDEFDSNFKSHYKILCNQRLLFFSSTIISTNCHKTKKTLRKNLWLNSTPKDLNNPTQTKTVKLWWSKEQNNRTGSVTCTNSWAKVSSPLLPHTKLNRGTTLEPVIELVKKMNFHEHYLNNWIQYFMNITV